MSGPNQIRAILFDLDDTLLTNNMDEFMPRYLKLISAYAAGLYDPAQLIQHLLIASQVMVDNADPAVSNEQAFWDEFSKLTHFDRDEMIPFFTRFYETEFDKIQSATKRRPEARPLVEWALRQRYAVVIATNPMFPRIAIDWRLAWAGIDDFDYDLVTSYEVMHFTKPNPGYYQEILNTDSEAWGGSNVGNYGGLEAQDMPCHGHPYSLEVALPPLGGLFFKPVSGDEKDSQE